MVGIRRIGINKRRRSSPACWANSQYSGLTPTLQPNSTTLTPTLSFPGDEREEITEWIVLDTPTTWLHRPKRIALSGGAQNPALVREKWIYYDDMPYEQMTLGLVIKEE